MTAFRLCRFICYLFVTGMLFSGTIVYGQGVYDDALPAPSNRELRAAETSFRKEYAPELKKLLNKSTVGEAAEFFTGLLSEVDINEDKAKKLLAYSYAEKALIASGDLKKACELLCESEKLIQDPKIAARKLAILAAATKSGVTLSNDDRFSVINTLLFESLHQGDWKTAQAVVKAGKDFAKANKKEGGEALADFNRMALTTAHMAKFPEVEEKVVMLDTSLPLRFCKVTPGVLSYSMLWHDEAGNRVPRTFTFKITHPFWVGKYELTQEQYNFIRGPEAVERNLRVYGRQNEARQPVGNISWRRAMRVCAELNKRYADQLPEGYVFRLPTVAEWHLAQDENLNVLYTGKTFDQDEERIKDFEEMGWTSTNAGGQLHPVGEKIPNRYKLYDMHGNASELAYDYASHAYNPTLKNVNPVGHLKNNDIYALTFCGASIAMNQTQNPRPVMTGQEDSTLELYVPAQNVEDKDDLDEYQFVGEHNCEMAGYYNWFSMRICIAPKFAYERNFTGGGSSETEAEDSSKNKNKKKEADKTKVKKEPKKSTKRESKRERRSKRSSSSEE